MVNQCLKNDLIDEYQITTVPVILGNGIRLFEKNGKKNKTRIERNKRRKWISNWKIY